KEQQPQQKHTHIATASARNIALDIHNRTRAFSCVNNPRPRHTWLHDWLRKVRGCTIPFALNQFQHVGAFERVNTSQPKAIDGFLIGFSLYAVFLRHTARHAQLSARQTLFMHPINLRGFIGPGFIRPSFGRA
ncbi:hypothetical protein MWU76_21625, partial [Gelidibacter sp. F2691]|nr:hypothetical protein [Gelidibacter sp. F2691]